MELIGFLWFLVKVLALAFLAGLLIELIVTVLIITPLQNAKINKKKSEILDEMIKKALSDCEENDTEKLEK